MKQPSISKNKKGEFKSAAWQKACSSFLRHLKGCEFTHKCQTNAWFYCNVLRYRHSVEKTWKLQHEDTWIQALTEWWNTAVFRPQQHDHHSSTALLTEFFDYMWLFSFLKMKHKLEGYHFETADEVKYEFWWHLTAFENMKHSRSGKWLGAAYRG